MGNEQRTMAIGDVVRRGEATVIELVDVDTRVVRASTKTTAAQVGS